MTVNLVKAITNVKKAIKAKISTSDMIKTNKLLIEIAGKNIDNGEHYNH